MVKLKTHYRGARNGFGYCGAPTTQDKLTHKFALVTCMLCRRHLMGGPRVTKKPSRLETRIAKAVKREADKIGAQVFRRDSLDSLMRRAFVDYEAGLQARLDALKLALQGWVAADRDDLASAGEGLRTEAQALVDYMEKVVTGITVS